MVQLLREKTHSVIADQTGAIATSQMASNVKEWNSVIQGVGNIVGDVIANKEKLDFQKQQEAEKNALKEQREQDKLSSDWQKNAEQADLDFINTEIGQQATISANDLITKEVEAGKLDPHSEEGRKRINEIFENEYSKVSKERPMQTEYGYTKLAEMQRKGADKAMTASYKTYEKKTKEKAQLASKNITKDFGKEAYKQGTLQDYQDIDGVKDYAKYVSKKTGVPVDEVETAISRDIAQGRLLGVADTDVITAASALGDEEVLRDHFRSLVNQDPETSQLSDKKKDEIVEKMLADPNRKEVSDADLRAIVGDKYFDSVVKLNTEDLERQKVALQRELSHVPPKSEQAKKLQEKLDEIKGKLEAADDTGAYERVRGDLKTVLQDVVKKRYGELKLQKKDEDYYHTMNTFVNAMSPDLEQATQARWDIWANENLGITKNQTSMGEWEMQTQSKEKPQMSMLDPFKEEIDVDHFASAYQEFLDNASTVRQDLHDTYEATLAMHDSLQNLLNGTYDTPIEAVAAAYDAINTMHNTPGLTQEQQEKFETLVYKATQDKGFGDMVSDVLNSADRYYPDTTWMSNSLAPMLPRSAQKAYYGDEATQDRASYKKVLGVPAGGVARTDVTNVQRMMNSETQNAIKAAMNLMIEASTLPEDQKRAAFTKIGEGLVNEKKRIYNKAIAEYGIDLNYLDEQLATRGQAYTQIGFRLKEYKGRLDDGTPIFEDIDNAPNFENARDYFLQMLQPSKSEKQKAVDKIVSKL